MQSRKAVTSYLGSLNVQKAQADEGAAIAEPKAPDEFLKIMKTHYTFFPSEITPEVRAVADEMGIRIDLVHETPDEIEHYEIDAYDNPAYVKEFMDRLEEEGLY